MNCGRRSELFREGPGHPNGSPQLLLCIACHEVRELLVVLESLGDVVGDEAYFGFIAAVRRASRRLLNAARARAAGGR